MSPRRASAATKLGSFAASPSWKRVFSRQRMSPGFIAPTACSATSPMQSAAKAIGRPMTRAAAAATGLSESLASRFFGRPKCASRITFPPLSAISVMVGATALMRVTSVTSPFCIGTLRSTRTSTRLPLTSASSRVRKAVMNALTTRTDARAKSGELAHRHRGVDHAIGEAPFVVVPRHHPHQGAVDHLGLVHVEDGRMRIVVEVGGDVGRVGVAEDALELLLSGALDRGVDLVLRRRALGDELEVDDRDIRRRHAQ